MKERHLVSHPSRREGLFFSSSPAALEALVPPVAHKLPTGAGLNQNDKFFSRNPKGLNREGER